MAFITVTNRANEVTLVVNTDHIKVIADKGDHAQIIMVSNGAFAHVTDTAESFQEVVGMVASATTKGL